MGGIWTHNLVVIATDCICIGSCKYNYRTITTTTATRRIGHFRHFKYHYWGKFPCLFVGVAGFFFFFFFPYFPFSFYFSYCLFSFILSYCFFSFNLSYCFFLLFYHIAFSFLTIFIIELLKLMYMLNTQKQK